MVLSPPNRLKFALKWLAYSVRGVVSTASDNPFSPDGYSVLLPPASSCHPHPQHPPPPPGRGREGERERGGERERRWWFGRNRDKRHKYVFTRQTSCCQSTRWCSVQEAEHALVTRGDEVARHGQKENNAANKHADTRASMPQHWLVACDEGSVPAACAVRHARCTRNHPAEWKRSAPRPLRGF